MPYLCGLWRFANAYLKKKKEEKAKKEEKEAIEAIANLACMSGMMLKIADKKFPW